MKHSDTQSWANHHAVLFCGDREKSEIEIKQALGISDSWTEDNDIVYMNFEDMGINDAHQFQSRAIQLPYVRDHVTFVLVTGGITREAQNSLLKLFEDTPRTAQFFVIVPSKNIILPTLLSRFLVRDMGSIEIEENEMPGLSESAQLLTKIKDDDSYREVLRRVLASKRGNAPAFSQSLLLLESFTDSKGASQKMLFEHALISFYESRIER